MEKKGCGCEYLDEDKSICYVEGVVKDYTGSDLHENVWYSMRPPRHVGTSASPSVSARNVEITRSELTGKIPKWRATEKEEVEEQVADDKHPATIVKQKSNVKFLIKKSGD